MHQLEQLKLFEIDAETPPAADNGSSYFSDPSFAVNKTLPIHRWVPWIAGFSSSFVREVLDAFLKDKGTVLDPFSGVGTTLVEAVLCGHSVIGFEINPYAALACRAKVNAWAQGPNGSGPLRLRGRCGTRASTTERLLTSPPGRSHVRPPAGHGVFAVICRI